MTRTTPSPKLVFDAKNFYAKTGIPNYIRGLIEAIHKARPSIEFVAIGQRQFDLGSITDYCQWRTEPSDWFRSMKPNLWLKTRAHRLVKPGEAFLASATLVPLLPSSSPICAVVHDLNHILVPETMSFGNRLMQKLFFGRDIVKAGYKLSNSQGTKQRVQDLLGISCDGVLHPLPARLKPIPFEQARRTASELGLRKFILFVGTLEPRKNLPFLLKAFAIVQRDRPDLQLAIVGGKGWSEKQMPNLPNSVKQLGFVDDGLLCALYRSCECFVLPSIYEGFGMPILEARLQGAPTACTDIPEMREAGGESTCYFSLRPDEAARQIMTAVDSQTDRRPEPYPEATLPESFLDWLDGTFR